MYISYINKENGMVITRNTDYVTLKNVTELYKRMNYLDGLYDRAVQILERGDVSKHYLTEYILKKDKTTRRIDIPDDYLKNYQRAVLDVFSNKLELIFPSSVYGYVKGRNARGLAEKHIGQYQVIKVDIKDFFPNCTLEFILKSMSEVYPFCLLDFEQIETILKPCMVFYDGRYRLPQGAPTSPILSNIAMIPIDYALQSGALMGKDYNFVYTRFADDIIISHKKYSIHSKNYSENRLIASIFGEEYIDPGPSKKEEKDRISEITSEAINNIKECLKRENPDFELNMKKTRVLFSEYGNIWMLGISVGDRLKIGNKKKQRIKSTLWHFLNECEDRNLWPETRTRQMLGVLGYAEFIEPDFVINLIANYEQKTGIKFKKEVKKILCV